ncbi:MAG: precorrin-4 C(11)-methyltransferase [Desulfovibrionaceae bacterium]|jgi:precorrin-4/cobalt-precorrin-4 C11-methyltransferase|nr:precorrin-4 C(11)-methyltransferase [Desulfovibrionaceae bacterium]
MNNSSQVYFIGAGPGDPELITVRGRDLVTRADLVLYAGSLVPAKVVACAKPGAVVVDSAGMSLDATHALMLDTARKGGLVARVHTGDPSLFGSVREQIALLDRDGVTWAIIPGVTAAFAAAARAGVSFTVPETTQSLVITRLHGRTPVPESERLSELARHGSSVAVYLSADKAGELAGELRLAGSPENTVIVIGHKVGHPQEKIVRTTLAELEKSVQAGNITRQAVFLILPGETAPQIQSRLYAASFGHGFREAERPQTWPRMAVYAMTRQGLGLAGRIAAMAPADLFATSRLAEGEVRGFERIADQVRANFPLYHAHVFVAATGIVVRSIAPLLHSKTTDPAVVVCDQNGEHVVSLLSGHLGGANDLARRIGAHIGGRPVITTATDTAGTPAIDILAQNRDCAIADPSRLATINSVLAEGGRVTVHDPENRLGLYDDANLNTSFELVDDPQAQVLVSWKKVTTTGLLLHPRCLCVGIGCRRGVSREEIQAALAQVMEQHDLACGSLAALASVDLKADEGGLLDAAKKLGLPLEFFAASVLNETHVPNPSERVREKIGAGSVCEAASMQTALKMSPKARLIAPKTISGNVTVAICLAG